MAAYEELFPYNQHIFILPILQALHEAPNGELSRKEVDKRVREVLGDKMNTFRDYIWRGEDIPGKLSNEGLKLVTQKFGDQDKSYCITENGQKFLSELTNEQRMIVILRGELRHAIDIADWNNRLIESYKSGCHFPMLVFLALLIVILKTII